MLPFQKPVRKSQISKPRTVVTALLATREAHVCTLIATFVGSLEVDSALLTCDLRWEIA